MNKREQAYRNVVAATINNCVGKIAMSPEGLGAGLPKAEFGLHVFELFGMKCIANVSCGGKNKISFCVAVEPRDGSLVPSTSSYRKEDCNAFFCFSMEGYAINKLFFGVSGKHATITRLADGEPAPVLSIYEQAVQ